MKKGLSLFLSLILVLGIITSMPVSVSAANSGKCGANLTWSLEDNGTFTISGSGAMWNYYDEDDAPWYVSKPYIKTVVIDNGVTSIGNYAFSNCESLISVTIPESIISIGSRAFYFCDSIRSLYITDIAAWCNIDFADAYSNPLYLVRADLYINEELATEVIIPDGVKGIPICAFSNCKNITSVTIPDSVTSIGDYAFKHCASLASINIPDSVTNIGKYAFFYCNRLTSITTSASIGDKAFYSCGSLTSFTVGDGATSIGSEAFCDCASLTSVTIPDSVTNVGELAFHNCKALSSVYITDIAAWCNIVFGSAKANPLYYADNLYINGELVTEIVIPDGVTVIPKCAFSCNSLASVTIPNSVTNINEYAFYSCESLTSVTIPDSVTSIGRYTFKNCYNLTSVTIPDSVTSIGDEAFYGCESLTSVTIPDSVTSIGSSAFGGCGKLEAINVSEGNPVYSSENGVLFNKNRTTLIKYPENRENTYFKIPDTVTNFYSNAFYGANVRTVALSRGMTNIYSYTFSYIDCITCIVIPLDVENISSSAFDSCWALSEVLYEGTEEQWNNITVDSSGNKYLTEARRHYNVNADDYLSHYGVPVKTSQPTCTSGGINEYVCDCGYAVTEQVKNALGHNYSDEWTIDENATCDKPGSKSRHCSRCNSRTDITEIPQLKCSKPKLKSIETTEYGVLTKWSKVTGADSYRVYRKTSKSDWKCIGTTSKTYYTDKTAKSGTKYYYAVKSRNEAGNSSLSSSLSKYYLADPTLKTPSSSKSGVKLTWNKIGGAEGYMVYRKTGTGSYSRIATVKGSTKVTYTDKSAKKGKKYTYKVKAYYSKTYSAYSNTKTITDKY